MRGAVIHTPGDVRFETLDDPEDPLLHRRGHPHGRHLSPGSKTSPTGIGADSVLECVGTAQAMRQALRSARPGGNVGFDRDGERSPGLVILGHLDDSQDIDRLATADRVTIDLLT